MPPQDPSKPGSDDPVVVDLAIALERVASWLRRAAQPSDWNALALSTLDSLDRDGPQRVTQLVAGQHVSQPGMTGLVGRLEVAGLVERHPDPHDGRAQIVSLTEHGGGYLASVHRDRAKVLALRIRELSAAQRQALDLASPALEALAGAGGDAATQA